MKDLFQEVNEILKIPFDRMTGDKFDRLEELQKQIQTEFLKVDSRIDTRLVDREN